MKKVMDYKEHPEVLEWARRKYAEADAIEKKNWEFVFPELSESEDERIRERLVEYFNCRADNYYFLGFSKHELLAWLEKQKEQKPNIEICPRTKSKSFTEVYMKGWNDAMASVKPAEWSEGDESQRSITISFLTTFAGMTDRLNDDGLISSPALQGCVDWLKSLRSRPHWKPSEEQMKHLKSVMVGWHPSDDDCRSLHTLYDDLKKL